MTSEAKQPSKAQMEAAEDQIKKLQIPYEYDTKEYPIEVLLFKFNTEEPEKSTIVIPSYQREFIWTDPQKSRFIESLFLGVPIQPLFAAILDQDGSLELIDGSQRLRTIESFTKDEFKLQGLKKLNLLNGLKYSSFSPARKNKFQLINLRLHVITEKAELSIRQDIFDRINTSGAKANPSEVRKGALAGKFYEFVMEQSKNVKFLDLCPLTESSLKRGGAEELVLRFFAYSELGTLNKLKGSRLLDEFLIAKNRDGFDRDSKRKDFQRMLGFVEKHFPSGFRKLPTSNSTPRVRFEAISLGVHFALQEDKKLVPADMRWLDSREFDEVTTSDSSINPGRLKKRVDFVKACLLNQTKSSELHYAEG